jgi:hypothetical protein
MTVPGQRSRHGLLGGCEFWPQHRVRCSPSLVPASGGAGTAAWKCRTAACDLAVRSRKGLCRPCALEHRRSGLSIEEFAAAHIPVRVKPRPASVTAGCIVTQDGVSCVRPRHCQGLCSSHYSAWARYRSRMTVENWAAGCARPHTGQLLCLVGGCEGAALNTRGLCGYHWRAWSRDNSRHGASDPSQWAASQPPYLAAHQFSLAPMGELARWELLYGLQRGDEARRTIEPYCMRVIVGRLSGVATLLDGGVTQIPLNSSHHNPATKLEHLCWAIRLGFEEFTGVTPASKDVLDLRAAQPVTDHRAGLTLSAASLRTDLELARQEIRDLRADRDKLRDAIRRQLGQQLDAISAKDLTTRLGELTRHNQQLADQASRAAADSHALRARVAELEADLAAARTSLRRMIRDENRPAAATGT